MPSNKTIPKHIGIIMDGNGRWAQLRGLPRNLGHKQGAKTFRTIVKYAHKIGIENLTVYAFSTENWKRPPKEVDTIMNLLRDFLKETDKHKEEDARIIFLGDFSALDEDIQKKIKEIHDYTANKTKFTLNIALNYGARNEISNAAKQIAIDVQNGSLKIDEIDESAIQKRLYTTNQPDPDLIIRPSGEKRISNFLLWQSAYSEFVFMDVLWPDFSPRDLDKAIEEYNSRNRRFGKI